LKLYLPVVLLCFVQYFAHSVQSVQHASKKVFNIFTICEHVVDI